MDGVAVTLQTSEEEESEEADGKADERHGDTHPCDDSKKKLMDAPLPLQRKTDMTHWPLTKYHIPHFS